MKTTLLLIASLWALALSSQTIQIETDLLNKALQENRWPQEDLPEVSRRWNLLKKNYPVLQYDSLSGQVIIEGVATFPGISKLQAFKRLKEWAAINFSNVDRVTHYDDIESGKLIFKGYTEVTRYTRVQFLWNSEIVPSTSNLYFTMILTVKDGKLKARFEYLRFMNYRAGYALGSYYVPGEWDETSLKSFLPIVYKKSSTWEGAFAMLNKCDTQLRGLIMQMERYVRDSERDSGF